MTGPHAYKIVDGKFEKADPYLEEGEIGYLPTAKDLYAIVKVLRFGKPCWEFEKVVDGPDAHYIIGNQLDSNSYFIAIPCKAPVVLKFKQLDHGDDKILESLYSWDLSKEI